ncbi:ubiquinol-cytochrome c reductase iron-sulfur subunit [Nocardioides lianchengensis]|uniref:Cytochrome bc1 complex Rieske iron-sulfur subunit n=1 Tax=Nocardioides lianchengensis TaxID=1045774 RepID=A0A1G6MWZ6_9ACTN|nr:Rieske 2Fe-2S domain-containing protein [Nocardioides lianchengensis]NYG10577.1 ubiquinol-cytochrome c reductase iron-sulfur subunit [Nocardioides lianchengensis]SDC60073.1 ubiquinol-cytochrome c reductase iron-sulfur subunit [Nocardioides lianchengensis]
MSGHSDNLPVADDGNPGLPEHTWRPTDVDPKAEKRAERQVAALFGLSAVCAVLFVVAYFSLQVGDNHDTVLGLGASNVALGSALGGALLFIGIGIIQWARKLMADHEISELRHPAASSDEDRAATVAALQAGLEESGIGRRPLVRNSMLGAIGLLGAPVVVLLRDLGPTNAQVADAATGQGLEHTVWKQGVRIVRDVVGTPIRPSDIEIGDLFNAEPATIFETDEDGEPLIEGVPLQVAKSKGAVVLIRMDPADNTPGRGRKNWSVDGILCYSKICTHVGCPISLNERKTHHLLCPCHQSTFDLADAGRVIFGPAARALPQLPIAVDSEGYLVAQSDFTEPVGPSYWERDY